MFYRNLFPAAFVTLALLCLAGCGDKPYAVRGDTVTVPIENPAPGGASVVRLQVAGPELVRV